MRRTVLVIQTEGGEEERIQRIKIDLESQGCKVLLAEGLEDSESLLRTKGWRIQSVLIDGGEHLALGTLTSFLDSIKNVFRLPAYNLSRAFSRDSARQLGFVGNHNIVKAMH